MTCTSTLPPGLDSHFLPFPSLHFPSSSSILSFFEKISQPHFMATQKLRHPSLRPTVTLKSSIDPSISYNVVVTTHPHCHSIIANGGKSQSSPIYHLGHPNDINEKKKMIKKKQQLSGKLSRYGKRSKIFNLKSAVSCILNKAKTVLQVHLPNSVLRVGRDGREMECVEPYFSVPVVPVMATH